MKKIIGLFVITSIIFSCSDNRGWSAKDRKAFINSCISEGKSGMGETQATAYCECMQPKIEAKYPTIAAAKKIKAADLQTAEWIPEVKKCLGMEDVNLDNNNNNNDGNPQDNTITTGGAWSESDRDSWANTCAESLKNQQWSETAKKNYCDCVREKLEQKYSTFNEMNTKGTYEDGVEFGKQCAGALTGGGNQ